MLKKIMPAVAVALLLGWTPALSQGRVVKKMEKGWTFTRDDNPSFKELYYDDSSWQKVQVPHDWAIAGPFDMTIDSQMVQVVEDGENISKLRTGRTGALPFIGTGWYRYDLGKKETGIRYRLEFDGAMSHAQVYINGILAGTRPYGYSSFAIDITDLMKTGQENILAVRLENKEESSRWYPGAGLYRNVRLVELQPQYIDMWGTYVTTPEITDNSALLTMKTTIINHGTPKELQLRTSIYDPRGKKVAEEIDALSSNDEKCIVHQNFNLADILRWDPERPFLYKAISRIYADGKIADEYTTDFGIRTIDFTPDEGFLLNGQNVKLKGVCMHHDLGPLGTAVNTRAFERQLEMLKEMGCNAIRTSHNPPAPELLDLCDQMGFLVIDEAFDEWKIGKNKNGYANEFDEWAEKDLTDMIRRDRNHPCIISWSIGNEVREQRSKTGAEVAGFLANICRREDPTRPVSAGFNNYAQALENGLGEVIDVFGFNYKPYIYNKIHHDYPTYSLLGSETASTVSSRGKYHFPAKEWRGAVHDDFHNSSYDLEYPNWASTPDTEFSAQDDCKFVAGEFVWTGFDYLGEPTPYNETCSSRSSYFGIIDLAGMKKDRFWLYQSRWSNKPVLHILPHWNWKLGDVIPVHCYTNYPKVELFLNGKSLGEKEKNNYYRHRLIWENIKWEPGELKAVAYDSEGNVVAKEIIRTAGKEDHIIMTADRTKIAADGKDLSFIEISIVDKDGILCPNSEARLNFTAIDEDGNDCLVAICNGDPTSLESFCGNTMKAFSGKCICVVGKKSSKGRITLTVESTNLNKATLKIRVK